MRARAKSTRSERLKPLCIGTADRHFIDVCTRICGGNLIEGPIVAALADPFRYAVWVLRHRSCPCNVPVLSVTPAAMIETISEIYLAKIEADKSIDTRADKREVANKGSTSSMKNRAVKSNLNLAKFTVIWFHRKHGNDKVGLG